MRARWMLIRKIIRGQKRLKHNKIKNKMKNLFRLQRKILYLKKITMILNQPNSCKKKNLARMLIPKMSKLKLKRNLAKIKSKKRKKAK